MTDKDSEKPRTLADYIPPAPPEERKARREALSKADRERLEALERAVRDTEPDAVRRSRKSKRGPKSKREREHSEWAENKGWKSKRQSRGHNAGKFFFWAILIMIALAVLFD